MAEIAKSVLTLTADGSGLTAASKRAEQDMRRIGKAGKDLNTNLRLMRGGFGQIGHQIQDVAVQLQGGTDAMIVFGQQGSQIASLFGQGGAMLGAVLAISAGIAGPFIKSLTESTSLLEDLEKEARSTTASLDKLTGVQRKLAESMLLQRQAEVTKALGEAQDELTRAQARNEKATKKTIQQQRRHGISAERTAAEVEKFETQVALANAELERIALALDPAKKSMMEYEEELGKTNESLQEQIDTFGMNIVEIAKYKAEQDGVTTALENTNIALTQQLFLLQEQKKANEQAAKDAESLAKAEADAQRIIDREQQKAFEKEAKQKAKALADDEKAKQTAIKGVSEQLNNLDASNKKVFAMQKAYRMAEATMAAYQAATNALAAPFPFPIPQAMAGAALTLGLANVANIQAQSFEGGGFTGRGARAGGLDGKGGRMAMVHPNETIIDHTKGQGAGITIVNNVDASGAGADVDQKIQAAMQRTSQATVLQIQDLMKRRRFL